MSACPENIDYEELHTFLKEYMDEDVTDYDIDVVVYFVGIFIGAVEDKDDYTWKNYVYSEDSATAYDILEIMEKLELIKISMDGDVRLI